MESKFRSIVRRYRRRWITIVVRGVSCGLCSACRSDYRFPCLHPRNLRLRRKITSGDYFANRGDDCPF